uniref:Uncharacterized protein n=1 Tax=Rhizophora mucronata TaxID=61149 RepID=A0A2P2PQA9_RHIMU
MQKYACLTTISLKPRKQLIEKQYTLTISSSVLPYLEVKFSVNFHERLDSNKHESRGNTTQRKKELGGGRGTDQIEIYSLKI